MQPSEALAIRESLGLTRLQWAGRLEVNVSTVWRWENGTRRIEAPMAQLMRRHLADIVPATAEQPQEPVSAA